MYYIILYHIISYIISYHIISYILYRIVSYRIVSYRIVSYYSILLLVIIYFSMHEKMNRCMVRKNYSQRPFSAFSIVKSLLFVDCFEIFIDYPISIQRFPEQKSATIILARGEVYYIEALLKEARYADHVSVGVLLPSASEVKLIDKKYLFIRRPGMTNSSIE